MVSGDEKEPNKNDPKYASAIPETDEQSSSDHVLSPEQQLSLDQDIKVYKDKINKANAILFSNMSQTIVEEHKKYKIPFVLWETLQKRYAPRTTVSRISAGCDFANAHMNCDSESVPEYLTRLQGLRDHFADCGGIVDEAMYKGKMFERLPKGYEALAVSVMLNGDRVSPEEVKDQILEHYRLMQQHTNDSSGTSNAKAYTAQQRGNSGSGKSSNGNGNAGGNRGKNGKFGGGVSKSKKGKRGGFGKDHARRDDQKEQTSIDDPCGFCNERGHWKRNCLKQLWYNTQKKPKDNTGNGGKRSDSGGPSPGEGSSTAVVNYNWKQAGQYSRPYFAAVTYFAATLQTKSPNVWLYDSACDAYITCFKERLLNYREFPRPESVVGFGGVEVEAQGEGEGVLVDEFGRSFVLKPVLYSSEAEQPMLSMMQLQEEGGQLTFQGTNCTLVLPGGCTLYGKSINKLLHLTDFAREGKYTADVTTRSQADQVQADQGHTEEEAENGENSIVPMDIVEQPSGPLPVSETRSSSPIPVDNTSASSPTVSTPIRKPKQLSPKYLWHLRLAHASTTVMSKIPTIKSSFDSSGCLSCIRAKQHRLPFPNPISRPPKSFSMSIL